MSQEVISYFGFSCPFGGQFYVCEGNTTEFLGCCNSNPCLNDGACPDDDLRVATFNKDRYEDLPREECAGSDHLWYTCAFNNPPFMGCCQDNPCATGEGCATRDLGPAFLAPEGAQDENRRTPLLSPPKATTAPTTKSKTPSTTESSATATATDEGILAEAVQAKGSNPGLSTGAIVGIVLGCCAVIVILVAILFYKCGSRRARKDEYEQQPVLQYAHAGQYKGEYQAVPSPYSDSYNSSGTGAGRYSNESYARAKLSPGISNFQQPYNDDSHEYPAQAVAAAGRHPAHRHHHSYGHGHGLGLAKEPVQELDSTAVTVELSAELDAAPKELDDTPRVGGGTEAVGYTEGMSTSQGSSADVTGAYWQEMGRGQDSSDAYGQDMNRMETSGATDTRGGYGYQATGRGDNTPGDLVSAISYGQETTRTKGSSHGGIVAPLHGSPEMNNQPDWQVNRGSGSPRPALRRVPRRPLGSPRPPSPSSTPGPSAVGEPF